MIKRKSSSPVAGYALAPSGQIVAYQTGGKTQGALIARNGVVWTGPNVKHLCMPIHDPNTTRQQNGRTRNRSH